MTKIIFLCCFIAVGCADKNQNRTQKEGAQDREASEVVLQDDQILNDSDRDDRENDANRNSTDDEELDEDLGDDQQDSVDVECYKADEFICEIEAAIVQQTNDLRAPARPFDASAKISFVSRLWSESMSNVGFISHFGFPGSRSSDYRQEFGGSASLNAENVAMTYANSQDAEDIAKEFTEMWWNSSGHRANMQGNYAMIGVGVSKSGSRYYATQIFGRE